jgi:uncharacterized membrane protein
MAFAALLTWLAAVLAGLALATIWLIEYDSSVSASRLPRTVVSTHGLLAVVGLALWYEYLSMDTRRFAWAAAVTLVAVALLGLALGWRWIRVYRAHSTFAQGRSLGADVPPERHLPVPMVIAHGMFGVATIVLVALTALDILGT